MDVLREKAEAYWKTHEESLKAALQVVGKVVGVLFGAYLAASTLTSMTLSLFSESAIQTRPGQAVQVDRPTVRKSLNFRDVRKSVVARNIFNSEGEVPDEADPSVETKRPGAGNFDANARCQKSSLPIELVGTIIAGAGGQSLAAVREKGYSVADIYQAGDAIIGNEQAVVYAIQPRRLVLNNKGTKECVELKEAPASSFSPPAVATSREDKEPQESAPPGSGSSISLDSTYVEEALGPGFAKILEQGRLVPSTRDGEMIGFKLIGVRNKSLWRKIGLNSGDVIKSVNGVSMAEPDKGFAIFEALQNEREIRVEYLDKGNSPSNITIEIK